MILYWYICYIFFFIYYICVLQRQIVRVCIVLTIALYSLLPTNNNDYAILSISAIKLYSTLLYLGIPRFLMKLYSKGNILCIHVSLLWWFLWEICDPLQQREEGFSAGAGGWRYRWRCCSKNARRSIGNFARLIQHSVNFTAMGVYDEWKR